MDNISQVNVKELGETIDMIKDIEQTMYYYTIIEAMEKSENHIAYLPFVAEEEKKKRGTLSSPFLHSQQYIELSSLK